MRSWRDEDPMPRLVLSLGKSPATFLNTSRRLNAARCDAALAVEAGGCGRQAQVLVREDDGLRQVPE